ncbi:ribosome maturation factor RimM [uncultured Sphaerochaeta sp.]|jgi:16S rRNA processing protein RimM|uniref:ribosome maturation factor RimM n=1 Tax=uncultured Sphaerochaeta sp. TaxID=886478 RepID=UPI002AA80898|nr:ribosome maturation factor RimM [uncultured Sphaerochaeta sp.]MDC7228995.1 ribosome maturation factor RimM [Sphaerochaetaceae bacterium]
MEELLWTATVKAPFGVNGEVKIHPHNDDCAYLAKIKEVVLRAKDGSEQTFSIESFRMMGSQPLMKFKGFDNPEDARVLNGRHLMVPRKWAAPLKKGQYYVADLIGCALVHDGEHLAEVVSSVDGAQAVMLEVRSPDGSLYMVPYLKEFIGEVSLEDRTIELKTPWILA